MKIWMILSMFGGTNPEIELATLSENYCRMVFRKMRMNLVHELSKEMPDGQFEEIWEQYMYYTDKEEYYILSTEIDDERLRDFIRWSSDPDRGEG